jgi:LysW-gamma-L-lysine carboxypeptidase
VDEVEALERLVEEYSPSGGEESAVRAFCRLAAGLGYRVRMDPAGNGLARRGRGRPRLVFLGHIDTVPGRLPVGRRRGRLHGRGTVDAKGALAAALIAGSDFPGPGMLEVIACVGEETDSRGARYLARRRDVDAVIAGEPNRWDGVGVGYKGCLRFAATFRGPARHLSSPFPTSADRALAWAERLKAVVQPPAETSPFRSLTLKVAGVRTDVGAWDTTIVTVDVRLPPGTTNRSVLARLPRAGREPEVRLISRIEPWEVDARTPVVSALVASIRAEGARPTLWRKTGTSDLNLLSPLWKCPAAVYGPGDPHLDHSSRESVSERELRRSVRVLRRAFSLLAEGAGASDGSARAPRRP